MNELQRVADCGIVMAETGIRFRYRCFMDLPIGVAILYRVDKTPENMMQEIEIEQTDSETVHYLNTGQTLPVFTNCAGEKEIPAVMLNIYDGIINDKFQLLYVEEQFEQNHTALFNVYQTVI